MLSRKVSEKAEFFGSHRSTSSEYFSLYIECSLRLSQACSPQTQKVHVRAVAMWCEGLLGLSSLSAISFFNYFLAQRSSQTLLLLCAVGQPHSQWVVLAHVSDVLGRKGHAGQNGQGLSRGLLVVTSTRHTCLTETFRSNAGMCFPKMLVECRSSSWEQCSLGSGSGHHSPWRGGENQLSPGLGEMGVHGEGW